MARITLVYPSCRPHVMFLEGAATSIFTLGILTLNSFSRTAVRSTPHLHAWRHVPSVFSTQAILRKRLM